MSSNQRWARAAGFLYLFIAIVGPFSMMFVPSQLIVPGDGAATATKIQASEALFRAGMISDSLIFASEIVLTALLFVLFRPVSRWASLSAAFARLSMAAVQGVNLVLHGAVLVILSGGSSGLSSFSLDQRHSLMMLALDLHRYGVFVWEVFFALHCLILAWLIYCSGFFPRVLGALMALAGLGYLAESWGGMLLPQYAAVFTTLVAIGAVVGEVPFMLWLLVKGIDDQVDKADIG